MCSCPECAVTTLKVVIENADSAASLCFLHTDEDGIHYTVSATTYTFENGSYVVTITATGGPEVNGSGTCSSTTESTHDPEFAYGAFIDQTTVYSGPVTATAALAVALGDMNWEAEDEEILAEVPTGPAGWRGTPVSLSLHNWQVADENGPSATVDARRAVITQHGYPADLTLFLTIEDEDENQSTIETALPATITVPANTTVISASVRGGRFR